MTAIKYVAALYDGDELYDLDEDPYELNNLIDNPTYLKIKRELRQRIIQHIQETNDRRAYLLAYALEQGF